MKEPTWKHSKVFPIIRRLIDDEYKHQQHHRYVTTNEIAKRLRQDSKARTMIKAAKRQQGRSQEDISINMVAWFSAKFIAGESEYGRDFQRERTNLDGHWAYRPTQATPP